MKLAAIYRACVVRFPDECLVHSLIVTSLGSSAMHYEGCTQCLHLSCFEICLKFSLRCSCIYNIIYTEAVLTLLHMQTVYTNDWLCNFKMKALFSDSDTAFNPKGFSFLQFMGCSILSGPSLFPINLCDLPKLRLRIEEALWIKHLGQWGGKNIVFAIDRREIALVQTHDTYQIQVTLDISLPRFGTFLHPEKWLLTVLCHSGE